MQKIQWKYAIIDEYGNEIDYSDNRIFDAPCDNCRGTEGVTRWEGRFLCLACVDYLETVQEERLRKRVENEK